MLHILVTIIIFIVLLAILVLTHELGHFMVARWLGITVEEFGFGFPPRIAGLVKVRFKDNIKKWVFVRKESTLQKIQKRIVSTVYSLNLIPLGGFVRILGEDGDEAKTDPRSFASQSVGKRFLVLVAGIVMNFILGVLLFSLGHWIGFPEVVEDNMNVQDPRVQVINVKPNTPAQQAGIKLGDTIHSIILPTGETITIEKVSQLQSVTKDWGGQKITVDVLRGNDTYKLPIEPRKNPPEGEGSLGIELARTGVIHYPFLEALSLGAQRSVQLVGIMASYLENIVSRLIHSQKVQVDVSGPIGIVVLTNQMKEMGFPYLLQFAAVISLNLAFINFLPFPALDGGRILFLIIEKIKGKPVSARIEQIVHATGLYLLLLLMIVISFNDFFRFHDKFAMLWEKIQFWR